MAKYQDLRQRVAALKDQVATHKARLEQAESSLRDSERRIQEAYGVSPEQLAGALSKAEAEIEDTGRKIVSLLEAAGA